MSIIPIHDAGQYPLHRIVAALPVDQIAALTQRLRLLIGADVAVESAHGPAAARALSQAMRHESVWATLDRWLHATGEDRFDHRHDLAALEAGQAVVRIPVTDPSIRRKVGELLRSLGADRIAYYGSLVVEEMTRQRTRNPERKGSRGSLTH